MNIVGYTVIALAIAGALADDKLYRVNSRDVGWGEIDLTISETHRNGRISTLEIPRYGRRTAVESRFAMCAFTDMAIQRDFEVWIVSDGSIARDTVRVGFLKSESEDAEKVLGKAFVGDDVVRADVQVMNRMCGISKGK